MTSKSKALGVLMWKHFTSRKRRFIATPFEMLSPCIFFILLFVLRKYFTATAPKSGEPTEPIFQNTTALRLDNVKGPSVLLYHPKSELTDILMYEVGHRLNLPRLETFPDIKDRRSRGYYPLDIDSFRVTDDIAEAMRYSTAIVLFENMEANGTWPARLNYTIRMKNDFMTHIYKPMDDDTGPHERFGTIYEPFMRLQWAIDSSYLKLLTGNEVTQRVSIQELPFVKRFSQLGDNALLNVAIILLQSICVFSLLLPFVFLMSRLIEERANGAQELIKMCGVPTKMLVLSHLLNTLPIGLTYALSGSILLTITKNAILPYTPKLFLFIMLILHFVSIMSIAFAVNCFINSAQYSTTLSLFTYIFSWLPLYKLHHYEMNRVFRTLLGLMPHGPAYMFLDEVEELQKYDKGITLSNMFKRHSERGLSVFTCFSFFILQSVFLFLLASYLNVVFPGKYGVPMPWNFCLKKSFWSKKKIEPEVIDDEEDEEEPISRDSKYFEEPPSNAEVGIQISNVSKVYGSKRVLSHVSLEVLKGEITVLLGHNGAGKTTLMSIITGMLQPTEGAVYIHGEDVSNERSRRSGAVGMCPQHNLFFPDLTVLEHTIMFAMLRGKSYSEAKESAKKLLDQLNLGVKANSRSEELSGGMKRRLQLACALAGGCDVLILDEPTSGLDVETRRELWDLLLSLRGNRTVLLSTHFMEEADALGDRAAAIHSGTVKCYATPMFLKKNIGTGYRLSLTTIGVPKDEEILSVVTKIIPEATLNDKTNNSMTIKLPSQDSNNFPKLFTALEDKRSELGIDSIGVGVSTLEEVFLKLCSDVSTDVADDVIDGGPEYEDYPLHERTSGVWLTFRQFYYLCQRQIRFILDKKVSFFIFQLLCPIATIVSLSLILNRKDMNEEQRKNAVQMINVDIFHQMPERRVMYNLANPLAIQPVADKYKDVVFENAPDVVEAVFRTSEEDPMKYNSYLAGIELDDNNTAKVLYTTTVRHAAPVALNMLSNVLAAQYMPWADGSTITTMNYPIEDNLNLRTVNLVSPSEFTVAILLASLVGFIIISTLMNAVNLPIIEREMGTRHIHIMTGCSPILYWFTTLITHTVIYLAILAPPTIIVLLFDEMKTFNEVHFLGTTFLIIVVGSVSYLAFMYLASFSMSQRASGLFLTLVVIVFGLTSAFVKFSSEVSKYEMPKLKVPLIICSYVSPPHAFFTAMLKATNSARQNAACFLNKDHCGMVSIMVKMDNFDDLCCAAKGGNPIKFLSFAEEAPLKEIIIMLCQALVYMVLVILTQHGVFNGLTDLLTNMTYVPTGATCDDEIVRAEATYVSKAIQLPKSQITDSLLVNDAHKRYFRYMHPCTPCCAVRGISFSVKKGECFGLLGVNGAGKSTTFKMLTSEETPTKGTIFGNGYMMKTPKTKYLDTLGYCPQYFGLDGFLTGRENLSLLLTLRGCDAQTVRDETKAWIAVVGLEKYAKSKVRGYSGGCARRLAAALALCIGAATTLLDEPTAGVDVAARRKVWAALRRGLAQRRAVVITSHSMDEMEALCDRIAIMSNGRICALGGAAQLRAAYAAGHAVIIKIKLPTTDSRDETDSSASLDTLKRQLHEKFDCTLKDEHKTMLHYHINETMRYSELFAALEELKNNNSNLIEDYSVTETTLEEVFLSFAKPQPSTDTDATV